MAAVAMSSPRLYETYQSSGSKDMQIVPIEERIAELMSRMNRENGRWCGKNIKLVESLKDRLDSVIAQRNLVIAEIKLDERLYTTRTVEIMSGTVMGAGAWWIGLSSGLVYLSTLAGVFCGTKMADGYLGKRKIKNDVEM